MELEKLAWLQNRFGEIRIRLDNSGCNPSLLLYQHEMSVDIGVNQSPNQPIDASTPWNWTNRERNDDEARGFEPQSSSLSPPFLTNGR